MNEIVGHATIEAAAPQIAAISAFLGGFAATLLGTILYQAASAFIVCSVAATMLLVAIGDQAVAHAQRSLVIMNGTFLAGMVCLLASLGMCGGMRSRRLGWVTGIIAIVSTVLVAALVART